MRKTIVALLLGMVLLTVGCKARVSDNIAIKRYEDKVSYFQDQNTGTVYAIVVIKTGINLQEDGIGLSCIPESEITPEMIKLIPNYKAQ